MIKRFAFPLEFGGPPSQKNEVVSFEDYDKLVAISWVGSHDYNLDLEIRTEDGKEAIIDSLPIDYFKLGNGREEIMIDKTLHARAVRVVSSFAGGETGVYGSLVFTCEK